MRSRGIGAASRLPPEWLIVARWGLEGRYLSISWTDAAADAGEAPILLTPKRTVIGLRHERARAEPAVFRLVDAMPDGTASVGTFIPAEGLALLYGTNAVLRSRCKACSRDEGAGGWNLVATAARWVGEFIERQQPR